jgi:hypothetical protein
MDGKPPFVSVIDGDYLIDAQGKTDAAWEEFAALQQKVR